jgi:hypothetical protein
MLDYDYQKKSLKRAQEEEWRRHIEQNVKEISEKERANKLRKKEIEGALIKESFENKYLKEQMNVKSIDQS